MPADEGTGQGRSQRKARRPTKTEPPIDLGSKASRPTPTDRYDAMTRERIDALEKDKKALQDEANNLRVDLRCLEPENERLREALGNAQANGLVSSAFTVVGGGLISYATFAEGVSKEIAAIGGAGLIAGVVIMAVQTVRAKRSLNRPNSTDINP
jgi:hypothetical protein